MTLRISTGLRNAIANSLGFGGAMNKGFINIYSGAQPANADAAATGTLLATVSSSSLTPTYETQASQTITLAGTSGSVNTVTVGTFNIIPDGAVPFRIDLATTASDLADAINQAGIYTATAAAAVVTIKPRPGVGASHNTYIVATTVTTMTATSGGNMTGGVNSANGLFYLPPNAGTISKATSQIWSFNGLAIGTAGWFRAVGALSDPGTINSTAPYYARMDGSIGTSGSNLNLSNISITVGSPATNDSFEFTIPAQ